MLKKWNIKPFAIVSDNASNMKSTANKLQVQNLGCVAHTIQLSINVGLQIPEIAELLTRCRRLLNHFSHSVQATETLLAQQKLILDRNARKDKPLYLITDTPTRWNSTFMMLERMHKIHQALDITCKINNMSEIKLHLNEWNRIEELLELLQPFYDVTNILSGESYPTVSLVYPIITGLYETLQKKSTKHKLNQKLKETVCHDIQVRYINPIEAQEYTTIKLACILDPRCKNLDFLNSTQKQQAWSLLQQTFDAALPTASSITNPTIDQMVNFV